jgi:hypothetical protein
MNHNISFLGVLVLALTLGFSAMAAMKASDCVLRDKGEIFSDKTAIENSRIEGKEAFSEIESVLAVNPAKAKLTYDQFGYIRMWETKMISHEQKLVPRPEEPCVPQYGARIVRECVRGENPSKAVCVSTCEQWYQTLVNCF